MQNCFEIKSLLANKENVARTSIKMFLFSGGLHFTDKSQQTTIYPSIQNEFISAESGTEVNMYSKA